MDNLRLILLFTLAAVLLLLYQAWVQDYGPIGGQPQVAQHKAPPTPTATDASGSVPPTPTIPPADVPASAGMTPAVDSVPTEDVGTAKTETVRVETDLLSLEIARRGGAIVSARLVDYPQSPGDPETKFRLLKPEPPNLFIIESGVRGPETGPLPADSRTLIFQTAQDSFSLKPGEDTLEVVLTWSDPAGAEIQRR